ncbi:unnamed protein product [Cochlearia groenlandica]
METSGNKDPEQAWFYPPECVERHGSRRSGLDDDDDDDELMKSRQHLGEAVMSYYDPRKASPSRQQNLHQSPSRDRTRIRRSGSRSYSRSRSRSQSPLQRVRRDGGGSYDRQKSRARVSPRSRRDVDDRYDRFGDYDACDGNGRNKKARDTEYYAEDSREQQPVRVGGRTDNSSDFPDDSNNNSRRETSDPISRSHRNEPAGERETQRRDAPKGEFNRTSNVPCRFFASGNCRNGNSCRFSHHGVPPARSSPERKKPQNEMFSRHENTNNHSGGTTERTWSSHRWYDTERASTRKSNEASSITMSEAKGNNGGWLGDMEMSPDWNYGVKNSKKPVGEEHGVISQSAQSRVPGDTLAPGYENGHAAISQQDGNQRSIGMFSTVGEKTISSWHHNLSNNIPTNTAPPVQTFNQNIENHSEMPYQSTPLPVGKSQVLLPTATIFPGGLNSNNLQNTVSREELNHISNISASLAQFFGKGQPIPQLHPSLNPNQTMQGSEVCGSKEQSSHTQSSLHSRGVPLVTPLQINNSDTQQVLIPENLVSLAANPKASSEENLDKKTDEEAGKEKDGIKTREEEEGIAEEAEKDIVEEGDGDETGDENKKKEKDPKGMKAFKFALVEIVKELLKPAWKEGGMNKDAYKNIVKKVVDKVTGAIQTGNIPQTQDKIDHYLSASKPKLTKLVQAYISKVKKS